MSPWRAAIQPAIDLLALNRAVSYVLAARIWQLLTYPVTVWLISRHFEPAVTDRYMLFGSLLAFQTLVELGLPTIVLLIASHEWARLNLDGTGAICGDQRAGARLASLDRQARRWFARGSLGFFAVVGLAGVGLGELRPVAFPWLAPWLAAVAVNTASLNYLSRMSLLEGCNQVGVVNGVRLVQTLCGTFAMWICIRSGAGLWGVMAANACRWAGELYLVHVRYRRFFATLSAAQESAAVDWRQEVWPLQWRMALQTVSSWFLSKNFFVALAFPTQQTGVTGRIGMTWSILEQIQSMSLAWIQTRGPEFGMSVARGEQQQLDQKFRKSARVAMGAFVLAGAAFVGVLGLFPAIAAALSSQIPAVPWEKLQGMINQFLPWPVAATLVAALTGLQLAMIEQFYVRLFKIDPFLVLNVANGPLAAGLFVMFGWQFGVLGAFAAYGAYCWLITLPVSTGILLRERARRRVSSAPPGPPSF